MIKLYSRVIKVFLVRPSFRHSESEAHFIEGLFDKGEITVIRGVSCQKRHITDESIRLMTYLTNTTNKITFEQYFDPLRLLKNYMKLNNYPIQESRVPQ